MKDVQIQCNSHTCTLAEVARWWRKARRTTAAHLQEVLVLVLMLVVQVL